MEELAVDLGIAVDEVGAMKAAVNRAHDAKADVLVTLGGASVGDYDLVQQALVSSGMELGFWRIAMRPGKPLMHGRLGPMRILGLPGNPTSSMVCSILFLRPLLRALHGESDPAPIPAKPRASPSIYPPTGSARTICAHRSAPAQEGILVATPASAQGLLAREDDGGR